MEQWYFIFLYVGMFAVQCVAVEKCVFIKNGESVYTEDIDCQRTSVCNRNFAITSMLTPPYSNVNLLMEILNQCCGKCKTTYRTTNTSIPLNGNTMQAMGIIRNVSDFIFPFLAPVDAKTLYGWYFVPIAYVPSFMYVTKKEENVLSNLIVSSLKLYPLVIICLSLAVISGFVIWLLETWFNEKEFPRPFFAGWFEGFWWSFISMTTVGYGDKTPKLAISRIFSVIWILMGISLFNILTAEITSILVATNNPPPQSVRGKLVGVLKYREYDKSYVTRNGGLVYHTKDKGKSENFYTDISDLVRSLREEEIDGIILDKNTVAYAMEYFKKESHIYNKELMENADFMLHSIVLTEKLYVGEKMAYGVIVKDQKHYEYFGNAITDNRISLMSDKESEGNEGVRTVDNTKVLFNPNGNYFIHGISAIFGIIAFIILVGIIFELRRRKINVLISPPSRKHEMDQRNPTC